MCPNGASTARKASISTMLISGRSSMLLVLRGLARWMR